MSARGNPPGPFLFVRARPNEYNPTMDLKKTDSDQASSPESLSTLTESRNRMRTLDWRNLVLGGGILKEPVRDDNRLVFWLPANRDREFLYWERIGTVPRGEVKVERGICATPVTSVLARQRAGGGFLGKIARKLTGAGGSESWTLPDGQPVEKCGERKTDLVLAWPEDEATTLDEASARGRWPGTDPISADRRATVPHRRHRVRKPKMARRSRRPRRSRSPTSLGCPVALAEQLLEKARQEGDRSREAAALIDLGIVVMNDGDLNKAVTHLDKAILLARELGDRAREIDALHNLGYALLAMGQPRAARQVLQNALPLVRQTGRPIRREAHPGATGHGPREPGDPAGALALANQALEMTRTLGDRQQEIRLLWNQAIAYADMNQRDQAMARGQESVDLLRKLGKPEASWYGAQLQRYRMDLSGLAAQARPASRDGRRADGGQHLDHQPARIDPNTGPGLLRMAVSATKAMMKFIGSGLKTTAPDLQQIAHGNLPGAASITPACAAASAAASPTSRPGWPTSNARSASGRGDHSGSIRASKLLGSLSESPATRRR